MDTRVCSFCQENIEPGTGMLYVKRDGTTHHFCSSKCRRNLLGLKRVPRRTRWTKAFKHGA